MSETSEPINDARTGFSKRIIGLSHEEGKTGRADLRDENTEEGIPLEERKAQNAEDNPGHSQGSQGLPRIPSHSTGFASRSSAESRSKTSITEAAMLKSRQFERGGQVRSKGMHKEGRANVRGTDKGQRRRFGDGLYVDVSI
jgi:hypothetical protein